VEGDVDLSTEGFELSPPFLREEVPRMRNRKVLI